MKCLFCEELDVRSTGIIRGDGAPVFFCPTCSIRFVDVEPPDYEQSYFEDGGDSGFGYGSYEAIPFFSWLWQISFVTAIMDSRGSTILDVGCATGKFLELANAREFDVSGVDISSYARERVEQKGFRAFADISEVSGRYDVITLWDTLEHVSDPRAFLSTIIAKLSPAGVVVVSTPNPPPNEAEDASQWLGYHSSYEHISFLGQSWLEYAGRELFGGAPVVVPVEVGPYFSTVSVFSMDDQVLKRIRKRLACFLDSRTCDVRTLNDAMLEFSLSFDRVGARNFHEILQYFGGSVRLWTLLHYKTEGKIDWIADVADDLPSDPVSSLVQKDLWRWLTKELAYLVRDARRKTEDAVDQAAEYEAQMEEYRKKIEELTRKRMALLAFLRKEKKTNVKTRSLRADIEELRAKLLTSEELLRQSDDKFQRMQRQGLHAQEAIRKLESALEGARAQQQSDQAMILELNQRLSDTDGRRAQAEFDWSSALAENRSLARSFDEVWNSEAFKWGRVLTGPGHALKRYWRRRSRVQPFGSVVREEPATVTLADQGSTVNTTADNQAIRIAARKRLLAEMPRVSVILPVYNHGRFLADAIRSVLRQSYSALELIVVDDGSSEDLSPILAEFGEDARVRYIRQAHGGLPIALNTGQAAVQGTFVTWTSADNVMGSSNLERLLTELYAEPDAVMAFSDYRIIDATGSPLVGSDFRQHNQDSYDSSLIRLPSDVEQLDKIHDNFIGPSFLYHRSALLVGGYDDQIGVEDYDYWNKISVGFRIVHVDVGQDYYEYRVHADTLSARAVELSIADKAMVALSASKDRRMFVNGMHTFVGDSIAMGSDLANSVGSYYASSNGEPSPIYDVAILSAADATPHVLERLSDDAVVLVCTDSEDTYLSLLAIASRPNVIFLASDRDSFSLISALGYEGFPIKPGIPLSAYIKAAGVRHGTQRSVPVAAILRTTRPTLRIGLQTSYLDSGGLGRVVLGLALALKERGHSVVILETERIGSLTEWAKKSGLSVVLANGDREYYRSLVLSQRLDVMNAHFDGFGLDILKELGISVVQTIHNSYVWLDALGRESLLSENQWVDAFVAVSRDVKRYSHAVLGWPAKKISVIHNASLGDKIRSGSDPRKVARPMKRPIVLATVGSIYAAKNQMAFVKSMAEIHRVHPEVVGRLYGAQFDSDYMERILQFIDEQRLEQVVQLMGAVESMGDEWEKIDCLVMPSAWEGWSLAMTEATVRGIPVVATEVGAARDLISDNGIVLPLSMNREPLAKSLAEELAAFETRTHAALTAALLKYLDYHEKFGAAARAASDVLAPLFDTKMMADRYVEVYYGLLSGRFMTARGS